MKIEIKRRYVKKVAQTSLSAIFLAIIILPPAFSDNYQDHLNSLNREISNNPLTENGYWLEMQNVHKDWEKMILVFGYADPGDKTACEEIRAFAAEGNSVRHYRCSPVN